MTTKKRKTTSARLAKAIGVTEAELQRSRPQDDLSRRFFLDVTKSGHVFIREKGQPVARGEEGGLPAFSTDTREQAVMIRGHFCRLARDGSGLYRHNHCLGDALLEIEDLEKITAEFRAHFDRQIEKHAQPRRK